MLKEELDKELEEIQDLVKPLILWLHKRGFYSLEIHINGERFECEARTEPRHLVKLNLPIKMEGEL